jgi:hypothetical protein
MVSTCTSCGKAYCESCAGAAAAVAPDCTASGFTFLKRAGAAAAARCRHNKTANDTMNDLTAVFSLGIRRSHAVRVAVIMVLLLKSSDAP